MTGDHKLSTRNKLLVLVAVMASLLEIIDTSIVNVAIPTMMGNLGATLDEISWVITGYIIANAIVLPIASWMSEQLGRKRYYTGCILLFTVSSVACGLAPNLTVLVIFRIVQGFAGGALLPTSQALIYEAFPPEMAGIATAIFGMSVMIGPTIGPTLGGYLTDNFGWRSIFNINLPIGIAVMILSYLLVEDVGFVPADKAAPKPAAGDLPLVKAKRKRDPVDVLGLVFLVVGIGSLQYVLERGNADDWFASSAIVICTFLAVGCITGLIWWELRTEHPILELRHFKNNNFRSGVFLMSALGLMLYSFVFVVPIFSTNILGLTATDVGELFIPGALAAAVAMGFIGRGLQKYDARIFIFFGVVTLAVAFLLVGRFDSATSVSGMFWPLLIRGIAMSLLFVPINTAVLSQFRGASIGEAAGMLNLCRQLGGSIGIATLSTFLQRYQVQAYQALASHVTMFDPATRIAEAALAGGMKGKMAGALGLGTWSADALKILYFKAQQQAFILSFQKVIYMEVAVFSLVLIPLFLMKKPPKGKAVTAH